MPRKNSKPKKPTAHEPSNGKTSTARKRHPLPKNVTIAPLKKFTLVHPNPDRGSYVFRVQGEMVQTEYVGVDAQDLYGRNSTLNVDEAREFWKRLVKQGFVRPWQLKR